jgi:hypothetical protein
MSYLKVEELILSDTDEGKEREVAVWRNEDNEEIEITFDGMAWASEGLRKKSEVKKVIKFLQDALLVLK